MSRPKISTAIVEFISKLERLMQEIEGISVSKDFSDMMNKERLSEGERMLLELRRDEIKDVIVSILDIPVEVKENSEPGLSSISFSIKNKLTPLSIITEIGVPTGVCDSKGNMIYTGNQVSYYDGVLTGIVKFGPLLVEVQNGYKVKLNCFYIEKFDNSPSYPMNMNLCYKVLGDL